MGNKQDKMNLAPYIDSIIKEKKFFEDTEDEYKVKWEDKDVDEDEDEDEDEETYNSCLEDRPKHKIKFVKENCESYYKKESNINSNIIKDYNSSMGISILTNDSSFKIHISRSNESSSSSK